jgi:hypothetical protein
MNPIFDVRQLDPWNDPVDLIRALVDLPRERLADARARLEVLTQHSDVDVRTHAFRRLFVHLKDPHLRDRALEALRRDPEAKVRRVAAHAIAATSGDATRQRDTRVLVDTLCNDQEYMAVRGAAYESLLLIHDRSDFPPANRDIDLATDVDWPWIRALQTIELH